MHVVLCDQCGRRIHVADKDLQTWTHLETTERIDGDDGDPSFTMHRALADLCSDTCLTGWVTARRLINEL